MFFLKKRQQNEKNESQSTEVILKEYLQQISATQEQKNSYIEKSLEEMKNSQLEMQKFLRKRMETLDDFLDELQEAKETEEEKEKTENAAADREKQLCQLIGVYSEQLYTLEEILSEKEGWKEQFSMMKQKRNPLCGLAQIQETGNVGESFDYRLHEIIETKETDQESREGMIAKVYVPGLMYQGKIIKKAQVCVYKK